MDGYIPCETGSFCVLHCSHNIYIRYGDGLKYHVLMEIDEARSRRLGERGDGREWVSAVRAKIYIFCDLSDDVTHTCDVVLASFFFLVGWWVDRV